MLVQFGKVEVRFDLRILKNCSMFEDSDFSDFQKIFIFLTLEIDPSKPNGVEFSGRESC